MEQTSLTSKKSFDYSSNNIEETFSKAYNDLAKYIFRHIYFRVSEINLAEDLTSETFLKSWKYLSEGKEVGNMKSFIYKVANNLVIDYYRVKNSLPASLDAMKDYIDPKAGDSEGKIDRKLDLAKILKVMSTLPDAAKQIILYRYIDELSIEEIKQITGKSTINIYVILHRGLKALKNKLKQNDQTT